MQLGSIFVILTTIMVLANSASATPKYQMNKVKRSIGHWNEEITYPQLNSGVTPKFGIINKQIASLAKKWKCEGSPKKVCLSGAISTITFLSKNTFSYEVDHSINAAPHDEYWTESHTFNLKTGKEINLLSYFNLQGETAKKGFSKVVADAYKRTPKEEPDHCNDMPDIFDDVTLWMEKTIVGIDNGQLIYHFNGHVVCKATVTLFRDAYSSYLKDKDKFNELFL